ncbi:MAG: hypothetical protein H6672_21825 [Anaerolineaceae bacterium]|nr:hypothetical protein [Anaerolineaceae bacterium]
MATQSMPANSRKQVRNFVIIWVAVTLIMGACTFIAIFTAYGALNDRAQQVSVLPPTVTAVSQAAAINPTPIPTRQITNLPTNTPPPTVAIVAQAATSAATATDAPPPTPVPTLLPVNDKRYEVGIQVQVSPDFNPDNQDLWMGAVADQLHMKWIKQQVRWEDIESERGNYDWGQLDFSLPIAAKRGIHVMLSIVTAPEWAREPGVDLSKHGPPANPQDYANFVSAILQRYPGMVHAVEIWNEMNLDREWTSVQGLSAQNYVTLLRTTYQAVKAVDPGVIVISGALSPTGGWTEPDGRVSAIDDFSYLDGLIAAGMLNYADCVGAHHNGINMNPNETWDAVTNDPTATFRGPFDNKHHSWSFRSTLQTYANKIQVASSDLKLCVTEFGWASTEDLDGTPPGFEFANDNTLEEQKQWTIDAINNMEQWDIVWLAFLWNLNYGPQAGWDPNNDNVPYSIIGKDWNFRPVYDAIAQWELDYQARTGQ